MPVPISRAWSGAFQGGSFAQCPGVPTVECVMGRAEAFPLRVAVTDDNVSRDTRLAASGFEPLRMFEQARRSVDPTRWHLFNLCGDFDHADERRATADVRIDDLCIRCARLARAMLSPDERTRPHGTKILAAAQRSIRHAFRDSPTS